MIGRRRVALVPAVAVQSPAPAAPATGTPGTPAVGSRARSWPQPAGGGRAASLRARREITAAAAALAGVLLLLAFPPIDWVPLAPVGVAVLALACRGRSVRAGLALGLIAGLVFFVPLVAWVRLVGVDAWLELAASQAVFVALLGGALAVVTRLPGWPLWTACLWVAQEAARSRVPFGGFPWGRLGFSQAGSPYAPYAAVGGVPLVGFAVALSGGLLAWGLLHLAGRRRVGAAGLVAAGLIAAAGPLLPLPTGGESTGGPATTTVALVQGNVPRLGLDAFAQVEAVLKNHANGTVRLAAEVRAGRLPRPDLVIWPENSSDLDPFVDPEAAQRIGAAATAVGVPVLVGAILEDGPRYRKNAGVVWDPRTGPGAVYVKRHPVPFAEYVPFRSVLTRVVGRFDMIPKDIEKGRRAGVLTVGPARLGDVICFEVAYDGLVTDTVTGGGRALVVQTNNASFGFSGETHQQLAMSRLRAVEHGRTVLVAATTGVSAVIAPDGRVLRRSPIFAPDLLVARVPLRDARTLADRVGAGPEAALSALGLLALAYGLRRRRP